MSPDEVIGQVLSVMKTQAVPYLAVYTALRPSQVRQTDTQTDTQGPSTLPVALLHEPYWRNDPEVTAALTTS